MSMSVWVIRYVDRQEVPLDKAALEAVLTEHGCAIPWNSVEGSATAGGGAGRSDVDDRRPSVLVAGDPKALCEIDVDLSDDGEVMSLAIDRPCGDAIWPLLYDILGATDSFLIAPPADIAATREELLEHVPDEIFTTYVVARSPSELPEAW
ncbi:hypothetical protein [Prescottella agglutinans]|uniref:Uncharacterized protein n=1 Tax=Prescottella agglutinans TaxID=1644129 RepID=A0ABT6MJ32_9NOCA|nr:hypothetical protein [Prescottella agglutinans]MDH6284333.1 hypothetical protein [Prescottella agglutinans]